MRRRSLIAALALGLAGCSSSGSDSDPTTESGGGSTASTTASTATATPSGAVRENRMSIGSSFTYDSTVKVTVDKARLANTLTTTDTKELDPGDGNRFLLVHVTTQNVSDGQARLPPRMEFAAILGRSQKEPYYDDNFNAPSDLEIKAPVTGPLYFGQKGAFAGVKTSGWLVFEVPADTDAATIAWGRQNYEGSGQSYWKADLSPNNLSGVSLKSVEIPETAERYTPTPITLTVTNTGGVEGTFAATITNRNYDSPVEIKITVPAGESVTKQVNIPFPANPYAVVDEQTISLGGSEYTLSYTDPTRTVGNSFTTSTGLELTTYEFATGPHLETYDSYEDSYTEVQLPDGSRWVFVHIGVQNTGNSSQIAPYPSSFSLLSGSGSVGSREYPPSYSSSREFRGTVDGNPYDPQTQLAPGERIDGWLVYKAPLSALSDLGIRWEASIDYEGDSATTVSWTRP